MKCLVTSARPYDREALDQANEGRHELTYVEASLSRETAGMARGFAAVCPFVDDCLDSEMIDALFQGGTRLLALRSTGYNHVDLSAASRHGMVVMRVKEYSPQSVAEFAVGMMLTLNRRLHRAWSRVRDGNFLLDGLLGFDMYGKTVGIVGTGRIGLALSRILAGMGCRLLGFDSRPNPDCEALGMAYLPLDELLRFRAPGLSGNSGVLEDLPRPRPGRTALRSGGFPPHLQRGSPSCMGFLWPSAQALPGDSAS